MRAIGSGIIIVVSCLLAAVFSVRAGTIELRVRDENGAPIARAAVALRPEQTGAPWVRLIRGESDTSGRITFAELDPGQYTITLRGDTARMYVAPEANPRVAPPRITLAPGETAVEAELELWRGVPVYCEASYDGHQTPTVTAYFREADTRTRFELILEDGAERSQLLLPGRWEIWIDPPPGFLLTDVAVNGRSVEGFHAFVELMPGDSPNHVAWYYSEPAVLHGRIAFAGEEVGVTVAARLLEPGPWIDAAKIRGGSAYESVEARVDQQKKYEMVLPDGRWEVRAMGPRVAESDPEVVDLTIAPGEARRQDFTVWDEEGDGTGIMAVRVEGPSGEPVRGATVEVWPLDPDERRDTPIARERADYSFPWIRGVPAGDWIVGAAREDYIEGTAEVPAYDPEDENRGAIRVRLRRGATMHVAVDDDEGKRAAGVKLVLERLDEIPDAVVQDPDVIRRLLSPEADSDTTGHAWIRGIWPGRYRLTGRVGHRLEASRFVRFRQGDRLVDAAEFDLQDEQEVEVQAVLVPAARVSGHLVCADGHPTPGMVSLAAIISELDPSDMTPEEFAAEARLTIARVPLRGNLHDRFVVGPLEEGFYFLGFRPEGYERWTWAPGEENPEAAVTVHARVGDPTNIGTLEIDCSPAIRLAPTVASGNELPDLRERRPREKTVTATGTLEKDGNKYEVRDAVVDFYRSHVVVRGLPEGKGRIDVSLLNRFFRPVPQLAVAIEDKFDRGRVVSSRPVVTAIGGVILVIDSKAVAARLTSRDGSTRIEPLVDGRAEFPSLVPETYRVDLCADPACAEVTHHWPTVEVGARQLVEVK